MISVWRTTLHSSFRLLRTGARPQSTLTPKVEVDDVVATLTGLVSNSPMVPATPSLSVIAPRRTNLQSQAVLIIPPAEDPLLSYFTSMLLKNGNRHKASRIVTLTLQRIHALTHSPPLPILREAISLASPSVKIVTHKKNAKNVPTPFALGDKQRTRMAIRWILKESDGRGERSVSERLARVIFDIIRGDGNVLKKKEELHRLAVANRSNARVRL